MDANAITEFLASRRARLTPEQVGRIHHPVVGELQFSYETLELGADPHMVINVYTAERAGRSEQALNLLASWAATPDTTDPADQASRLA